MLCTKSIESILKNDAWDVVPRPEEKAVVTLKWLYRIKHGYGDSAEKFKASVLPEASLKRKV